MTTTATINAMRAAIIEHCFGSGALPSVLPTVTSSISSPVGSLTNLARVDQLDLALTGQCTIGPAPFTAHLLAYHFVPTVPNGKAALHCGGHANTFDDDKTASPTNIGYGDWRVISELLAVGTAVTAYYMPTYGPVYSGLVEPSWPVDAGGSSTNGHVWLMQHAALPMRYFLTLPIACVNYLVSLGFSDITSVGLSGGGWTSTWLGALDTRITRTYSVAGTQPLYMRTGGSVGDLEQNFTALYRICNYLDLYIMAAQGRRHVQAYNEGNGTTHLGDDQCFGPRQYSTVGCGARIQGLTYALALDNFKTEVVAAVAAAGAGSFDVWRDATADAHQVTWWMIAQIIADIGA